MVYFSGGVDSLSLKGQSTNFPCRQNVAAVNSTIPPTSSADSSSFSHLSFSKVSKGSGRHPVSQGFFLNSQWISTASALTSQLSPSKATFLATDTSICDYWKNHSLTVRTIVSKVMSLLFNMMSRLFITFIPRSKRL